MSKQSNAYEFSKTTRQEIYERDKQKCIIAGCNRTFGLGVAHIFIPRSKGGLGVKENGALLCQYHHHALDNGMNKEQAEMIKQYATTYLSRKYGKIDIDTIKYNKWKGFKYEN